MRRFVLALPLVAALCPMRDGGAGAGPAQDATRDLSDYRYFRALSIDFVGRPPTDEELAAFEQPGFDVDKWIDAHLSGPAYAERLRRIYMDALRLQLGPTFHFTPESLQLVHQTILGPDGKKMYVYFRHAQRRADPITDGEFCLSKADTGFNNPSTDAPGGTPHPVDQRVLDAKTVVVKPWWLYTDYRAKAPKDLYTPEWSKRFPGYQLSPLLDKEPDGKTPVSEIRVCREEAQTAETGTVFATGRKQLKRGEPIPEGRATRPPFDSVFARDNAGKTISCLSGTAFLNSTQCGCGIGLERCVPRVPGFIFPMETPIGIDEPFVSDHQTAGEWIKLWWSEEAKRFLDRIFTEDRDFREVLTAKWTQINGPLAQFYRSWSSASCCGPGAEVGYTQPEGLVQPKAVPDKLAPVDTATWLPIADRGPHAAGIMTMPVFLTKYGSRRARAHVLYNAFLCRDFVASHVKLEPSNEQDLTKRAGCSACHHTLEPMAAYYTRVAESDWSWLPSSIFPTKGCPKPGSATCTRVYDPAFGMLRGAYAAEPHVEAGPEGLAHDLVTHPDFAPCVVQNVAQSLLGRQLTSDDNEWKSQLVKAFIAGGYRVRSLVRTIVMSPPYRATKGKP